MTKRILINAPGAGERIMEICNGPIFRPDVDHSIASFDDGRFLGGFVICGYLGNSLAIHDGGADPRWCSRDMLAMLFDYVFRQLQCRVAYAPVSTDNPHAMSLNLRAGWRWGHVLEDAVAPGVHVVLLEMRPEYCKWLSVPMKHYRSGIGNATQQP